MIMLLNIDSHSQQCLICLSNYGYLLSSSVSFEQNKHDKMLAEFTRRILSDNNITLNDIEGIGIVSGPGSFTGLRIGFAFAKGLSTDKNINLIKVPTTQIYAYQSKHISLILKKEKIVVLIPGSANKFFMQEYDNDSKPITDLISIDETQIKIDERYLYVGSFDSINNVNYLLHKRLNLDRINPISLSELTFELFNENKYVELDNFEPDYYFDFVPKTK